MRNSPNEPVTLIREAAAWARENRHDLGYDESAPMLDDLADAVERGDVDASALVDPGWSAVMVWNDSRTNAT